VLNEPIHFTQWSELFPGLFVDVCYVVESVDFVSSLNQKILQEEAINFWWQSKLFFVNFGFFTIK